MIDGSLYLIFSRGYVKREMGLNANIISLNLDYRRHSNSRRIRQSARGACTHVRKKENRAKSTICISYCITIDMRGQPR